MRISRLAGIAVLLAACQSVTPTLTPTLAPTLAPTVSLAPTAAPTLAPTAAPPISLLVDTDVAPDDLVALSFLISSPNAAIAAVTVSGTGEIHCPTPGVDRVLELLERLGAPQIPVACGSTEPTALGHTFPQAFRDNADNSAGLDLPATRRSAWPGAAVDLIETTASAAAGLRVLTLGPLTNLAQALADEPDLASQIESIYIMGGAVDVPGNIDGTFAGAPTNNTTAEWNIYADPAAAQAVLDAGIPVRLVSLDGTNQVPVTPSLVSRASAGRDSPPLGVLAELFDRNSYMTSGSYYLWDALAAMSAAGYLPDTDFTPAHLSVDVAEGPTSGRTQRSDGSPNASYMTAADAAAIEDVLVTVMGGE